jgi:hypothetical protein
MAPSISEETQAAFDHLTSRGWGIIGYNVEPNKADVESAIQILVGLGYSVQSPGTVSESRIESDTVIGVPIDRAVGFGSLRFFGHLRKMWVTHLGKNAGYAGEDNQDSFANFREAENLDIPTFTGVLLRMSDKWSRIKSLHKKASNEQVGESLQDTLLDLANYCLIAICISEEPKLQKGWEDTTKHVQHDWHGDDVYPAQRDASGVVFSGILSERKRWESFRG